jgi:iron-sulfur cluster insertion protein
MNLDSAAIVQIRKLLAAENHSQLYLRVSVHGGGCSGMQYGFAFDTAECEGDLTFDFNGVPVLVDSISWQYLENAEISYESTIEGSAFVISNPGVASHCGCGSSFDPG